MMPFNQQLVSLDSSIGQLLPSQYVQLCKLLNINDVWTDLASVIENRNRTAPRFTYDDVMTFERHPNPASQLLNSWSTDYVTLRQVISCLRSAGLLRQASYLQELVRPPCDTTDSCQTEDGLEMPYMQLYNWTNCFSTSSANGGGMLLGQGGYSDVFKGYDEKRGRLVAVKRMKSSSEGSHCSRQQFLNEINVLSSCDHENVVRLIGYSTDGPFRCIVYEFMYNGSLEDRLACRKSDRPLTVSERLTIARDTARGLVYLHSEKYLIHMDIKSANILLDERLTAKVSDYGISRSGPSNSNSTSTHTNVIIGTTVYMAPEYLTDGRVSDKIDSYSYGVVLLELLTGLAALDSDREDSSLVVHVQETSDENSCLTLLDDEAGNWTVVDSQAIYQTALRLLSNHKTRPRIVQVISQVESWCTASSSSSAAAAAAAGSPSVTPDPRSTSHESLLQSSN